MTSVNYPGNCAVYPLYRSIVREIITASHRSCEIKVLANDKVRFALYEENKMLSKKNVESFLKKYIGSY